MLLIHTTFPLRKSSNKSLSDTPNFNTQHDAHMFLLFT